MNNLTEHDRSTLELTNKIMGLIADFGGEIELVEYITHHKEPCHFKQGKKLLLKVLKKAIYDKLH